MAGRTVTVTLDAAVSAFQNKMRAAAATTKSAGRDMVDAAEANREAWTAAGLALTAAGTLMALGLRKGVTESIAFQATLTKSTTLIGVARDEMSRMGDELLRMSDTGQGPQALAEALFFIQSAGLRGAEALDVLDASAKAASIGLGETATIADLVTSAVNAYGPEVLSAAQATDILIGTVREGKAEADELAMVVGRVLPLASAMGVQFQEVGAALASMTRTGSDAATSATQLQAILSSLIKPAQQSEAALNQMGLSSAGLRQTITEDGLWAALMQLHTAFDGNQEAMGRVFPNIRALNGFLDLTGANAANTAEIFENMNSTTGLLATGFDEWSKTAEASVARFTAAGESARIALTDSLTGPVAAFLDVGTTLLQWFVNLPGPVQTVIGGLAALSAGVLLLGGTAMLAATQLNTFRAAAAAAGTAALTMGGLLRGAAGFLLGPWGLAIALAATAMMTWSNRSQEMKANAERLATTLDKYSGSVTAATREMIALDAVAKGTSDSFWGGSQDLAADLEKLGVSWETFVNAVEGSPAALERVNNAIEENRGLWGALSRRWDESTDAAYNVETTLNELTRELEHAQQQTETNAAATGELNSEMLFLANTFGLVGEDAAEAAETMTDAWNDAMAEFVDLNDAYKIALSEKEEAERASAKAAAEAAGDTSDSWQDLLGDVELTVAEYIAQLETMAADQAAWADNMAELAGRIPDEMLDELARMGPEGAPLVAMLTDAGDDELARIIELWPSTTSEGMDAVLDIIAGSDPKMRAIARELGLETVIAIRDGMRANGTTLEQEAAKMGIKVTQAYGPYVQNAPPIVVTVDERTFNNTMSRVNNLARDRTVTIRPQYIAPGQNFQALSTGGLVRGKGGPTSDSNLVAASRGEFMVRSAAVSHYGVGLLAAINSMRFPLGGNRAAASPAVSTRAFSPSMAAAGGGGAAAVRVMLDFRGADSEMARVLRHLVLVEGGGNVQAALGTR